MRMKPRIFAGSTSGYAPCRGDTDPGRYGACAAILLLLWGILGSCAFFEAPKPPAGEPPSWDRLTPQELLSSLKRTQEQIRSLAGGFSISVDPAPPGQPSNLQGVFFVDRRSGDPRIRVKALGAFGRTLFDLVREGHRIEIYVPHQKSLYRGRIQETAGPRNPWMEALSEAFTPFSEARIRAGGSLEIREDEVILPLEDGFLVMDRYSGLVGRWHRGNAVVTYEQYQRQEALPALPTVIRAEMPGEPLRAVCAISQVSINPDLESAFDLSGYKPDRIRPLEDLDAPKDQKH